APLLATGHQTELYHAGVWAKLALISHAAQQLSGAAIHMAVDTDSPKHLALRWPGRSTPITDDPKISSAAWSGLLAAPSDAHLDRIERDLNEDSGGIGYVPMTGEVVKSLRSLIADHTPLSPAPTNATHELDVSLNLRHRAMLASPLFSSESS